MKKTILFLGFNLIQVGFTFITTTRKHYSADKVDDGRESYDDLGVNKDFDRHWLCSPL